MPSQPIDKAKAPHATGAQPDDEGSVSASAKPAFADEPGGAGNPLGAAGGAAAGAAAGAVSGVAAGPLGSLAGAVVGGVAGGLLGSHHLVGAGGTTAPVAEPEPAPAASREGEQDQDTPSPSPSSPGA